jgi:hypothetical protein
MTEPVDGAPDNVGVTGPVLCADDHGPCRQATPQIQPRITPAIPPRLGSTYLCEADALAVGVDGIEENGIVTTTERLNPRQALLC